MELFVRYGTPSNPGMLRHHGAPTHINEDSIGREPGVADTHFARRFETGVTLVYRAVGHVLQPGFNARIRLSRDLILASLHSFHVHADRAGDAHAEFGGAASHVGGIGACNHGLGRDASGVDARSSETAALDDRDFHPGGRQAPGEGRSGLTGPNDDCIEGMTHWRVHPLPFGHGSVTVSEPRPKEAVGQLIRCAWRSAGTAKQEKKLPPTQPGPCGQTEPPWNLRPQPRRLASRFRPGYRPRRTPREGSFPTGEGRAGAASHRPDPRRS